MIFERPLVAGIFIERINRFIGKVLVDGRIEEAHVPNTGRLKELLYEGNDVLMSHHPEGSRKTAYSIRLARKGHEWYGVDAQLTNSLAAEVLASGTIPGIEDYRAIRPEVKYGDSRFDFRIDCQSGESIFVEVKCVTLEVEGVGRFPDAPTERGRRHLRGLIENVENGGKSMVIFVCQGGGIHSFSPNRETDTEFSRILVEAASKGVRILAYRMNVSPDGIFMDNEIPIKLEG